MRASDDSQPNSARQTNVWESEVAERQTAETSLRSSQRRLQLFVENVTEVIWTMDFLRPPHVSKPIG